MYRRRAAATTACLVSLLAGLLHPGPAAGDVNQTALQRARALHGDPPSSVKAAAPGSQPTAAAAAPANAARTQADLRRLAPAPADAPLKTDDVPEETLKQIRSDAFLVYGSKEADVRREIREQVAAYRMLQALKKKLAAHPGHALVAIVAEAEKKLPGDYKLQIGHIRKEAAKLKKGG